ncbi:MAG: hypothetical protein ABSC24_06960 [Verrucomicrobiota bacterium]
MNPVDTVPLMLLALHMLALGMGMIIFLVIFVRHRRARAMQAGRGSFPWGTESAPRPVLWLALRSSNSIAVQAALGIGQPRPCPWSEGITGKHDFFISPPVSDWIIVTGSGLPHPGQDVDDCFHFLVRLSREVGHVQFFMADPVLHHHAWVRVENGVVGRAYAWVNETVWNQGPKSLAEVELNLESPGYGESPGRDDGTAGGSAAANAKKVPALAARWSFDPAAIDQNWQVPVAGIVGKSLRFCRD